MTDSDVDLRHDDHPVPPDGIERRRCSDRLCKEAREEWFSREILPKLKILFGSAIAGTVMFCASVFLYINRNAIRDYDLQARDKYVTLSQHASDVSRIESKIEKLDSSMVRAMNDVSSRLDRNLLEIQNAKKR